MRLFVRTNVAQTAFEPHTSEPCTYVVSIQLCDIHAIARAPGNISRGMVVLGTITSAQGFLFAFWTAMARHASAAWFNWRVVHTPYCSLTYSIRTTGTKNSTRTNYSSWEQYKMLNDIVILLRYTRNVFLVLNKEFFPIHISSILIY